MIVNAEETPFDPIADAVLRDQLGEVLPALAGSSDVAKPPRNRPIAPLGISDP